MTKYFKHVNQEWNYEELLSEEILVFSAPDDFNFSIVPMMKKAMKHLGHTEISVEQWDSDSKPYYIKSKYKGRWYNTFSLAQFFDYDTPERKKLFDWLYKKYEVELLTLEEA